MPKLVRWFEGDEEYVAIITSREYEKELVEEEEIKFAEEIELDGDFTTFPVNRALQAV